MDDGGEELVTQVEGANLIGRPVKTVHGWVRSGALKAVGRKRSSNGVMSDAFRLSDVRALAESRPPTPHRRDDPTEEELNAMIAEQMAALPSWWGRETCKAKGLNVAAAVARGLAEAKGRKRRKSA